LDELSLRSARAVVPIVLNLLSPKSVVDFGCGRGTWLKAWLENGVETALGLDGDYVDRDKLLIDRDQFRAVDLRAPVRLDRRFDLAMCLEVAEHLPARSARALVGSLAAAAPAVLFSAALPGQGGVDHVNEQWPPYWERLFAEQGMRKYDVVRPLIWCQPDVHMIYIQNLYLFTASASEELDSMPHFEPHFVFAWETVMARATFGWSSRALKYRPLLQRAHSFLSGATAGLARARRCLGGALRKN
jgi:SAM-dependent methyltransferase